MSLHGACLFQQSDNFIFAFICWYLYIIPYTICTLRLILHTYVVMYLVFFHAVKKLSISHGSLEVCEQENQKKWGAHAVSVSNKFSLYRVSHISAQLQEEIPEVNVKEKYYINTRNLI
jgi:type IV secretory pathway VirB3-like protein